jgi:hypothetical protein
MMIRWYSWEDPKEVYKRVLEMIPQEEIWQDIMEDLGEIIIEYEDIPK